MGLGARGVRDRGVKRFVFIHWAFMSADPGRRGCSAFEAALQTSRPGRPFSTQRLGTFSGTLPRSAVGITDLVDNYARQPRVEKTPMLVAIRRRPLRADSPRPRHRRGVSRSTRAPKGFLPGASSPLEPSVFRGWVLGAVHRMSLKTSSCVVHTLAAPGRGAYDRTPSRLGPASFKRCSPHSPTEK